MKLLLLLCTLSMGVAGYSQNEYYDALRLRTYINKGKLDPSKEKAKEYTGILQQYLINNDEQLGVADIIDAYSETASPNFNPFLEPLLPPSGSLAAAEVRLPEADKSLLSSIGSLDVTTIADGIAKFLVKRTREELNAAFFSRFYSLIKKDEYKDVQLLFPQTFAMLNIVGEEIYNYTIYLNSLRDAFEKDLVGMPDHLKKLVQSNRYKAFFDNHPTLKTTALSTLYLCNQLQQKAHPGKILAAYDINIIDSGNVNLKAAVLTTRLFSESLRANGGNHYWITKDSLQLLLNDPLTLQLYFGLIYQQAAKQKITCSAGQLTTIMAKTLLPATTNINRYSYFIKGLIAETAALEESIQLIAGKSAKDLSFSDYYSFYDHTMNFLEYIEQFTMLPGINGIITVPDRFREYLSVARAGGNLALDLNRRNYTAAIMNAYAIYHAAFRGSGEVAVNVEKFLLKYGSFVAAVAQAESSDEVAQAIEAATLPAGSSRVKRVSCFNVAINAYTGLFAGHETIKGVENTTAVNCFGVTAPIGISASWGHSFLFIPSSYEWSTSLFVSLVDLGAMAAFRFSDTTTAQVPSIQLKHLVSPGAFISLGIPKTPLSLNFGAQMGPNLRKVDHNNATLASQDNDNKIYWRFSTSICVDIPLLNLHTRPR